MFGLTLLLVVTWQVSACPFLKQMNINGPVVNPHAAGQTTIRRLNSAEYDISAVKAAIKSKLVSDQADGGANWFPDSTAGGNYGPNLIRLAWHCAGTYRISDGNGGCDGARIRFPPEKDWADNAGLTKPDGDNRPATIDVLQSVYDAHHDEGLTWADLIILAGNVAIEEMGGPSLDFCPGQIDADDGAGTADYWDGDELIYVNAGVATAAEIRNNFTNMGMNDRETVALIAGGHTFGRAHSGRSGFVGAWTASPSTWSNMYVTNLLDKTWIPHHNISGQFKPSDGSTSPDGAFLMMLQADVALLDDAAYKSILEDYKANPAKFKMEFGAAWYKLMTGGRNTACQPKSTTYSYDKSSIEADIAALLVSNDADGGPNFFPDPVNGGNFGPGLMRLAWHCSGTFRTSDGVGGCEGARIRFAPEKNWPDNAGLITTDGDNRGAIIDVLQSVYDKYKATGLTWADLIVLSGTVAIKEMGGPVATFCGGRRDDVDGSQSESLQNRMFNNGLIYVNAGAASAADIRNNFTHMGMNDRETVALIAGGHTFGRAHVGRSGFSGAWTAAPSTWSNMYVTNLLDKTWVPHDTIVGQFKPTDGSTSPDGALLMMLKADVALLDDARYKTILEDYKTYPDKLKTEFGLAWAKLMNGGRVEECAAISDATSTSVLTGTGADTSFTVASVAFPMLSGLAALLGAIWK